MKGKQTNNCLEKSSATEIKLLGSHKDSGWMRRLSWSWDQSTKNSQDHVVAHPIEPSFEAIKFLVGT